MNETALLELEHHPMHGGGRHAEEALQVGFGWWAPVDLRVGVEEGQVLPLGIGRRGAADRGSTRSSSIAQTPHSGRDLQRDARLRLVALRGELPMDASGNGTTNTDVVAETFYAEAAATA